MSLIEKAVERLDQLRRAGVGSEAAAPATEPVVVNATAGAAALAPHTLPAAEPAALHAAPASKVSPLVPPVRAASASRSVDIDLDRLNAIGMVTPQNPRSLIAEEFRIIKRPLLRNVASGATGANHGNLVMVTSSVPGEGKSFSALNLAMSIAMEMDHTVLLVDADVSRPSLLNLLGLPPQRGLMDVLLSQDVSLPDVLLRTNIEKLSILPAGMPYPRATELLASDSMAALLDEIATRYADRIVVFDSPPLLPTTEARVLASYMGQIVLVVEAERTSQAVVKQAVAAIEQCPIKLMLLNKTRSNAAAGYYGYYGSYNYGSEAA